MSSIHTPSPASAAEVCAIAELLGLRPDQLVSFKQPGPGGIGDSVFAGSRGPELDGFVLSKPFWLSWDGDAGWPHLVARYDSAHESVAVVSHETGPEFWVALVNGVVSAVAAGAVTALLEFVRNRRRQIGRGDDATWAREIRRDYDVNGTLRHEEIRELARPTD